MASLVVFGHVQISQVAVSHKLLKNNKDMTKLEMSFKAIEKANPYWSSYTSLAVAVMGKGYGKMAIGQAFNKLVEKEDYARGGKRGYKKAPD